MFDHLLIQVWITSARSKSRCSKERLKNGFLFTYLSVRAVHLELVDSLDTSACIDAIHRFIARRGQPESIISDNGTNFVGTAREFKEAFQELKADEMFSGLAERGIKWTFNPPAAPHFGGVWERLVRSCTI